MALNRPVTWEEVEQAKTLDAAEDFLEFLGATESGHLSATYAGHSIQANLATGVITISWLDPAQDIISLTVNASNSDVELITAFGDARVRLCAYLTARLAMTRAIQVIKRYGVDRRRSGDIPSALSLIDAQLAKVGCDPDYWLKRSKASDVRLIYEAMSKLGSPKAVSFDDCMLARDQAKSVIGLLWAWRGTTPVGLGFDTATGKAHLPESTPKELESQLRGRGAQCITELAHSLRLFMPLYEEAPSLFRDDVRYWLEATRPE